VSKTFVTILALAFVSVSAVPGQVEMLGPLSREAILEQHPDWQATAAAYQPKPDCLEKLGALAREVKIEIYLGTWCSDSKAHVSAYFKVLEMADTPLLQTAYIGIPEDKGKRAPYYRGKDILKLPTFLVFVDGREAGRIVETPAKSVEEDLVRILGL
jgi:thiol-disulfide isomerase/thioredoxin